MSENLKKELTDCPDWGKGGSYLIDPVTGQRTLIERTDAETKPEAAAEAPAPAKPAKK